MQTYGRFSVEQILPIIGFGKPKTWLHTNIGSFYIKVSSPRLECFRRNQICVGCNKVGNIFLLQSSVPGPPKVGLNCYIDHCPWCSLHPRPIKVFTKGDMPHLNMFHRDRSGGMILMTQDHIRPRSRGGSSKIENLQTMCRNCNQAKGDYFPA